MKLLAAAIAGLFIANGAFAQKAVQQNATLRVSRSGSGPMYIEGSIAFFRVQLKSGRAVEEQRLENARTSFSLKPGEYELVSYVRPCDGNCRYLDPPMDECRAAFSVMSQQTLYGDRQQTRSGACTLKFTNERPTTRE